MNVLEPWNVVFLAGFVLYARTRHVFEQRTKHNETIARAASDRPLLVLLALGHVVAPALYLFSPWLDFASYDAPAWVPWCGLLAMASALVLFWRSHADLGLNWSVELTLRRGHEIVERGVYRRIRHPMYAAVFLFTLAQGLLLANWLAGWSGIATFALLYAVRVPREERMMRAHFGNAYERYARRTGRLLPRWSDE